MSELMGKRVSMQGIVVGQVGETVTIATDGLGKCVVPLGTSLAVGDAVQPAQAMPERHDLIEIDGHRGIVIRVNPMGGEYAASISLLTPINGETQKDIDVWTLSRAVNHGKVQFTTAGE